MFDRHSYFADLIADVYHDPDLPEESLPERYANNMDEMRQHIGEELDRMHTTIVVPLTEMGQVLQQAERTMAKRNRKKLDYDRFKLGDKDTSLETSAHDYEHYNAALKSELPILFDHVERVVRSLFARLHHIQCVIYKRYMDHAHKVIDFSTIHENIIDDYYQHIAQIPHIMNSLDLFHLFPPSEFRAPIPPPKHPSDDNSDKTGSTTIPHPAECDVQPCHEAIGLGITPSAAVDVNESPRRYNAIALEDYDAQGIGDLSFHKNQQIEILGSPKEHQNQDGWLTAQISGETGLVPADHVKVTEQRIR
ncbi:predicted protein [Lichtheimia corymbifera JMRC:FSU:9682]|uniref:SH3 domain-containing protein n=1 Tax=Lichtheimia corymbifera JMRC:FSU:9682 TaxID=1263082 RepID=A0A068RSB3_9FUNG|nr:predicted protein [Lichtheimia corymbifera JMRC:FSU:9682]